MKHKILAFAFLLLLSPLAQAEEACEAVGALPSSPVSIETLKKAYESHLDEKRQITLENLRALPEYEDILKNSVEVIYVDTIATGHVVLRVGKKMFSVNGIASASIYDYKPSVSSGRIGSLFFVPEEKINAVVDQITQIYQSLYHYSMPPFSVYGGWLELQASAPGAPVAIKGSPLRVQGVFKKDSENMWVESPNGTKVPAIEEDGGLYLQSFSCSTSAGQMLRQFFNINVPSGTAKNVRTFIRSGKGKNIILYVPPTK